MRRGVKRECAQESCCSQKDLVFLLLLVSVDPAGGLTLDRMSRSSRPHVVTACICPVCVTPNSSDLLPNSSCDHLVLRFVCRNTISIVQSTHLLSPAFAVTGGKREKLNTRFPLFLVPTVFSLTLFPPK